MSLMGLVEPFQRLEEFSSFTSCIKCYGRPIIPPLLTQNHRNEFQQIRAAMTEKGKLIEDRRKQRELMRNVKVVVCDSITIHRAPGLECSLQEKSALWFPFSQDHQEGVSTAISKLSTSTIYSSVHTGAIVCSDVIENKQQYASRIAKDHAFNTDESPTECLECSNNVSCGLCQIEYEQNFHNCNFVPEVCPEVPCRTFSLTESSNVITDDGNSAVDEAECESLPTVILNDKNAGPDTDNESSITCITQSTDLDKYMDVSCEFSSSENSVHFWDASKSISQQTSVMSRSDDASSETIINTESELTPCASSLAKFTNNGEMSNNDKLECGLTNNEFPMSNLKRAHSIDSYMKILQSSAGNWNIKKSSSDPLNTNIKTPSSSIGDIKSPISLKTSQLIKEDSKESDESKDTSSEKDVSINGNNETPSIKNKSAQYEVNSSKKKHVRRNSYTLEYPSSALIFAHRDCSCSLKSDSLSPPHCSALEDKNMTPVRAFTKEKVDVTIPVSIQNKYPILNLNSVSENSPVDELAQPVVDIFPLIQEDESKKLISGNFNASEKETVLESSSSSTPGVISDENDKELNKEFAELNLFEGDLSQEHVKHIYEELRKQHEIRLKELLDEQQREWERVQNEWIEQEKLIYSKMLHQIAPDGTEFEDPLLAKTDSAPEKEFCSSNTSLPDDKVCTKCSSDKESICSSENNGIQDQNLNSLLLHAPPSSYCSETYQEQSRALINSYKPVKSLHSISQLPSGNTSTTLVSSNDSNTSFGFSYESCNDNCSCSSNLLHNSYQFPSNSAVLLPNCDSQTLSASVNGKLNASYHDKTPERCPSSESCNSNNQYEIYQHNTSSVAESCNLCVVGTQVPSVTSDATKNNNSNLTSCSRKLKFDEIPSKQTSEISFSKKSKSVSCLDILQFPNKTSNNAAQTSLKDKHKPNLGNIISLGCKTIKNGIGPKHEMAVQYKIIEITPLFSKKLERLPALVKGYLTRRLMDTERLQNLHKTIEDSYILLTNLTDELKLKGENVSEQDLNLRQQLFNQLMSAFYERYDICINRSIKEQMQIISESRNLRWKQKFMEPKQVPLSTHSSFSDASSERKLSSATLKALERKKRSTIDNRTYTIRDFKNFRARSAIDSRTYTIQSLKNHIKRPCSQNFSKTRVATPASIYKVSVGRLSPKRKTASSKSSISRHSVQYKWVP